MAGAFVDKLKENGTSKKVRWAAREASNDPAESGSDELSDMDTDDVEELVY